MQNFFLVGAGGAFGAMCRYGVSVLAGRLLPAGFPYGTLMVNVLGSLVMGLFVGWLARTTPDWQAELRLFVAIGILGGFTTFSSFSLDAISLFERRQGLVAAAYVVVSVVLSVGGLLAGLALVRSFPV